MSIELSNICASYAGHPALDDVSLTVAGPGLVGIVGPNGAGKSTLLKAISGLIQCSGVFRLNAERLDNLHSGELAGKVAYCAQSDVPAWPITVEEVVRLGRIPHRNDPQERLRDAQAVADAMAKMDLTEISGRRLDSLSGGERSRAMLARAVSTQAKILLVDEPTADLDPYHELRTMEILREEAEQGTYVLAVLHNLSLAARFCDMLIVLKGGRVAAQGNATQVLDKQLLEDVYGIEAVIEKRSDSLLVLPWRRVD